MSATDTATSTTTLIPVLCFCREQCYGTGYRCGGRKAKRKAAR